MQDGTRSFHIILFDTVPTPATPSATVQFVFGVASSALTCLHAWVAMHTYDGCGVAHVCRFLPAYTHLQPARAKTDGSTPF